MAFQNIVFLSSCCLVVAGYLDPACLRCRNAALCVPVSSGEPSCFCNTATSGSECAVYNRNATNADQNNIALDKSVVHCKSGANETDLANNSMWSNDVCYNVVTDNVMIVDLEGTYNVKTVAIVIAAMPLSGNVSVSVGWHLGENCSVTDEVKCGNYVWNGTYKTIPCQSSTTGRYIRIQNNRYQNGTVICIDQAAGTLIDQSIQQARFSKKIRMKGSALLPFQNVRDVSKLSCARKCLQDPKCLNFRFADGRCLCYGGLPGGIQPVTAYRYHGIA